MGVNQDLWQALAYPQLSHSHLSLEEITCPVSDLTDEDTQLLASVLKDRSPDVDLQGISEMADAHHTLAECSTVHPAFTVATSHQPYQSNWTQAIDQRVRGEADLIRAFAEVEKALGDYATGTADVTLDTVSQAFDGTLDEIEDCKSRSADDRPFYDALTEEATRLKGLNDLAARCRTLDTEGLEYLASLISKRLAEDFTALSWENTVCESVANFKELYETASRMTERLTGHYKAFATDDSFLIQTESGIEIWDGQDAAARLSHDASDCLSEMEKESGEAELRFERAKGVPEMIQSKKSVDRAKVLLQSLCRLAPMLSQARARDEEAMKDDSEEF